MVNERDFEDFIAESLCSPETCHVAWCDDSIVGFMLSYLRGNEAVAVQLTTVPLQRRLGIGRALMTHNLLSLHAHGAQKVRLRTDANGLGRALYERIGFREVKCHMRYRKPMII